MTREERKEYNRQWRLNHADYQREYQKAWAKRNPDKIKQYKQNSLRRRALRELMQERGAAAE